MRHAREIIAGHRRARVSFEFDRRTFAIGGWARKRQLYSDRSGVEADPGSRIGG